MSELARRIFRLSLYAALTLPTMPIQALLVALGSPAAVTLPRLYHRLCARILGFRIELRGERSQRRPTLFVSNHVSYLDITVLGALIGGSFIAKSEVAGWPFFGWLAKLQRTVFVDRRARTSTAAQRAALQARLNHGDSLILFPEGTSSDGNRVLPFKSALFSVADFQVEDVPLPVQPVSIAYTKLDGIPLGRLRRPEFAWYGDMDLASHLWHLVGLGTVTVVVEFHPVVTLPAIGSRKALAEHCRTVIAAGMSAALVDRVPRPARAASAPASPGPAALASPALAKTSEPMPRGAEPA